MSAEFNPTFQALIDYLESKNFNYTSFPEEQRVTLSLSGKNANYRFTARISHDGDYLQITGCYPFFVRDEKLRFSTAELITRANYTMPIGKFEMDLSDGEVRFHVTHVIENTVPPVGIVERLFMTSYFTLDKYFPALMQHIHAGYTPEDAVFHAEFDKHAEAVQETPKVQKTPDASETPKAEAPAVTPKPRAKRASRKKTSGNQDSPQGDLPL
jgi:hypothetical protein